MQTVVGVPAGDVALSAATPSTNVRSVVESGISPESKTKTIRLRGPLEKLKSDPGLLSLSQWNMRYWCVHPDKAARKLSYWTNEEEYIMKGMPKKSSELPASPSLLLTSLLPCS